MDDRRKTRGHSWLHQALVLTVILALGGCTSDSGLPVAKKRSWETSFNRGGAAAVAALYAPDAELVVSGEAPIRGREAIRAVVEKMIQSGVKVSIGTDKAEAAGDLAYFYGPYSVSSTQGVVERGTYVEVWHRIGGHWLIELDVNSTGAPVSVPRP